MKDMNTTKTQAQLLFFLLTFLFTLPTYILVALVSSNLLLTPEMATFFIPLGAIAPIGAGLIMASRDNGKGGMKELVKRGFDYMRIKKRIWYVPIFFLLPLIYATAFGILLLFNQSVPEPPSPVYLAPILFLSFFILGFGEEVGWMGYAFDKMQKKSGSVKATIFLGLIWALWHVPFYVFMISDFSSILIMLLCLFGIRYILVWIYNNTNQSVFGAICFHVMFNVSISVTPNYSLISGIALTCILIIIAVVIIAISGGVKQKIPLS